MKSAEDWYSASDSALRHSSYGLRLHIAAISPVDGGESLRLAFKANDPQPWAIEVFIRPWRGRSPAQNDIDSIARHIDSEAATWLESKPRRKKPPRY